MSGKHALIRGTAILTITSFVTRFMGFFYRIFLGHTFGEENVGLYQLVFPVYALGISFSCAGTELALSRCVAQENAAGHPEKAKELFSKYQNIYLTEDSMGIDDELSKQCTLITVDEIISIKLLWFQKDTEHLDFWKEVKKELLKM